jgi:regulatory protein
VARDGAPGPGTQPAPGAPGEASDADVEGAARELCLRLLTARARSRSELGTALRGRGVPGEIAERVLDRLDEVGLVDDREFAGQWVRSRHRSRGLGRRALAVELHRKGVAADDAEEALAAVDPASERARAADLVASRLRTMTVRSAEERVRAGRRLVGMLGRKGYPAGLCHEVVRAALADLGADEDELGPADLG